MSPTESKTPWSLVLAIVGAGIFSAFQVGKATVSLGATSADLGLSLAVASWMLSAFAVVGALAGVAIGLAVDHAGARRMVIGGLLAEGFFSAAATLARGAPLLLTMRVLEGFGFLAVTVAAPALIARVTHAESRERASSVWATFMPIGFTAALLAAPLLAALGWRGFWLLNGGVLVGYAALIAVVVPTQTSRTEPRRSIARDIRGAIASPGPWLLAGLFASFTAAFFAVFGFLPTILAERLSLSSEVASRWTAVAVIASAGGNLVCGQLLARGLRPWHILLGSFALLALTGVGIFAGSLPGAAGYLLCIVFSFTGGFVPVVLFDAVPRHAPRPELAGATMGFAMQGNNLGLVIGPAATGAIAGALGFRAVSLLVIALALGAAVLVFLFRGRPGERRSAPRQSA